MYHYVTLATVDNDETQNTRRKNMLKIETIMKLDILEQRIGKAVLIDFLHTHLDRFRDTESAISKAIDYAFSTDPGRGGYLIVALDDDKLVGAVVMNNTGMQEFIPEYYLIYIAVDAEQRGQGIGTKLLQKTFDTADGDIALHVEYDNPAKRLYERLGFTTKYAEMRCQRSR
jgi:ribosomal protein S18 acetylase RimI-like enzyme